MKYVIQLALNQGVLGFFGYVAYIFSVGNREICHTDLRVQRNPPSLLWASRPLLRIGLVGRRLTREKRVERILPGLPLREAPDIAAKP